MNREAVIRALQRLKPELSGMGVRSVSLFGSVARARETPESDIDLLVRYDPAAHLSLLDVVHIENFLSDRLGRPVQLVRDPIKRPGVRERVESERLDVF